MFGKKILIILVFIPVMFSSYVPSSQADVFTWVEVPGIAGLPDFTLRSTSGFLETNFEWALGTYEIISADRVKKFMFEFVALSGNVYSFSEADLDFARINLHSDGRISYASEFDYSLWMMKSDGPTGMHVVMDKISYPYLASAWLSGLAGDSGKVVGRWEGRPVPEPATMLLFGAGLAGLGMFRKRFKKE